MVPKCKLFATDTEHVIGISILLRYTGVYNFNSDWLNEEKKHKQKQKCLQNNKYIKGHRCERINMAAKRKIFVTVS